MNRYENFDDFGWDKRLPDETYDEYKTRIKQEQAIIEGHLEGTPLEDGEKGHQRKEYLEKKKQRNE